MRVSEKVLRCKDRDIIKVEINDKYTQPFYRSTGRNSGARGTWFPFDGVLVTCEGSLWFDKARFCPFEEPTLRRYGTEELRDISYELARMEIPEGEEVTYQEVNEWLGYKKDLYNTLDNYEI